MILKLAFAVFYGDTLMSLYNQCKPYELEAGASDAAREDCVKDHREAFDKNKYRSYKKMDKSDARTLFASAAAARKKKSKWASSGRSTSSIRRSEIRIWKIFCCPRGASPSCPR